MELQPCKTDAGDIRIRPGDFNEVAGPSEVWILIFYCLCKIRLFGWNSALGPTGINPEKLHCCQWSCSCFTPV